MSAPSTHERLIQAVISGNYADFIHLCTNNDASVSECITTAESWNLLHFCFINPHQSANIDIVDDLISRSVPTDSGDTYGNTPLCYAIRQGSVAGVQSLLKSGANPNHRNADGVSPLRYCFLNKPYRYGIVKYLLESGAKLDNRIDPEGKSDAEFIKMVAFDYPDILELVSCYTSIGSK